MSESGRNFESDPAVLTAFLRDHLPAATFETSLFPSGAFMLDVRIADRLFVVAYRPGHSFGLDEVREGDGMDTSFRHSAQSHEEAATLIAALAAVDA